MIALSRRTLLSALGTCLMVGPIQAQGRSATPEGFAGRVFVNERGGVRIHTYVASPQGAMVTSHVVETPAGLVLIDGQLTPSSAAELKRYLDGFGKPLRRVILSHAHPDHWFGFHHLGRPPVHAGPITAQILLQNGAQMLAAQQADSSVPNIAGVVAQGTETIDGVEFRFRQVLDTEAPEITVIEIPAAGAAIVQDLVYNKVHMYVTRQIDHWVQVLQGLERGEAPLILAGHGEPASPADLGLLVRYLETVKPMISANIGKESEAAAIVEEMTRAFPEFRVPPLLQLGLSQALKS